MADPKQVYKFIFSVYLQQLTLALKFPCLISVTWKRGEKADEVKQKREIENGVVTFNEKLSIQCNMMMNSKTKIFEEKKTIFIVKIFSQKGNKQAGEVSLDVSEILNTKNKEMKFEKNLEKCPDKNAKLTFTLTGYVIEEISQDIISNKSQGSILTSEKDVNQHFNSQPDFKKKKNDNPVEKPVQNQNKRQLKIPESVTSLNMIKNVEKDIGSKDEALKKKLEDENKKLEKELLELNELNFQNESLLRKYKEEQKKIQSYYTKKYEESKKQLNEMKVKAKVVEDLVQKKEILEKKMCECKEQMGNILNYAIMKGNNKMTEEISNIYQMSS